ncbi:Similar to S.cerevisiae protein RRP4 (Exosome non-catalytic core component) [Malassezia sympodialis ATCC 42132]|uniref:Similar to S.cerevisiae protein RRP4 (Exosome non-catalytic core component) n=1 Tax=Malassezia sympodialis (strain ATCC 42132) TaxID=1230383 RepID=A0A1M8AC56_MALS4|nr:Similar to S.cerevisiae protein RRP4 (Exosome non-catalytic core component) [Malassezia sympodialis ATCC 42132]
MALAETPFRLVRAQRGGAVSAYTHASGSETRNFDIMGVADDAMDEEGEQDTGLLAMPGQGVATSLKYMRGHGCYLDASQAEIVSSLSGTIEKVNKLVSVRPVRTRYRPEVGDLVIGRITDVQSRRWKVDIGAKTDASLQLSSINLPGGVQRKKLESDELQMRHFFQEGDLVVAEVQSLFQDGSVGLHTRSLRYGKLRNGALAVVPPVLVRRHKSHFLSLMQLPERGVDLVLGLNGWIWVSKHVPFDMAKAEGEGADRDEAMETDGVYSDVNEAIPAATRQSISLVCQVLAVFAHQGWPVTDAALEQACALCASRDEPLHAQALVQYLTRARQSRT